MRRQAQAVLATAIVAILAASTIATASESGPRQTLESGFRLDPWKREVVAGGPNWDDCWQLPDEPQFVIDYESGGYSLSFGTFGYGLDTTLQVTTPTGDVLCDNNSGGDDDALITLGEPTNGRYEVRVGTFWPDDVGNIAEAYVTERVDTDPTKPPPLHQWTLEAGFHQDPRHAEVVVGGPIQDGCGHLPDKPSLVFDYESGNHALSVGTIGFRLNTTLMVTTPEGEVLCDDDGGDYLNALITLGDPASGRYEVRVGTVSADDVGAAAEVYLTERIDERSAKPAPAYQWRLEAGFDQDPMNARVVVGGPIIDECGLLPLEPSLVVDYESGGHTLSFGTLGYRIGATLQVTTPAGDVLCDDDSGGDYDALITLRDPASGRYEIRAGTHWPKRVGRVAEVYVTERIEERSVKPVPVHQWTLEDGFGPDPLIAQVSAGGSTDGECGQLPEKPQVVVDYEGDGSALAFGGAGYWFARTSLQVTTPAGDVLCDRDYDDARAALIVLGDPADGRYEVRVGSNYSGVVGRVAKVFVTERVYPGAIKPAPVHRLTFDAAFGLNRSRVGVTAGGLTRDDCGHLPNEAQLVLDYESGYYALSLGALGHGFDTSLQVTTPMGDVLCDDSSGDGRDARVALRDPPSGRYEIRVGTSSIDAVGGYAEVHVAEIEGDEADITATDCNGWETDGFFGTLTADDVRQCVEAGAELDARDVLGNTPLHLAVGERANPDVVQVLLDSGADPNARNDYDVTPLHVAPGIETWPDVVRMLLSAGADPNALDRYGLTPLHLAVGVGAGAEAVQLLLDAGADPNARAYLGLTALNWAVREDTFPDVVQVLLAAGADPNLPDTVGVTPLHRVAGFDSSPEAVRELLGAGADPNAPDVRGLTPLHWAAGRGTSAEIVQALLDAGADPDSRDRSGKLPIDLIPEDSLLRGTEVYRKLRELHDR
ncbi:MAG: ankyrin repeat domain-containing protein [Rhodobacteraceae bacterium]|nr:ankyrin repeat domain-containing protein [Paracoccaceae bacterium]MCY4137031.1 ankyrin repeat domain-containing protein [Paracoccaceae bacterium]